MFLDEFLVFGAVSGGFWWFLEGFLEKKSYFGVSNDFLWAF